MNRPRLFASIAAVLSVAAVFLFDRVDKLETRVQNMEKALLTLEPLRNVMAQARPNPEAYQARQATGVPNVPAEANDNGLGWCPAVENGGAEWLLLSYPKTVLARAVEVHANFNPGAVIRVSSIADDGTETEVWEGLTPREGALKISELPFHAPIRVSRLKLTLDTGGVPGWNEIDAVALVSDHGDKHWATQAEASSSWQAAPTR